MNDTAQTTAGDRGLLWTMRVVGVIVVTASIFFLTRSLSLSPVYDYFFGATLLLGVVTFAAGFVRPDEWQREGVPQMEYVRAESDRRS